MKDKRCKELEDGPKVMAYPKILARKEEKFSHMRDLFQSPKVCLNLKGS